MTLLTSASPVSASPQIIHALRRSAWRRAVGPARTALQRSWLTRPGALTAGLRTRGNVTLIVLAEHTAGLTRDEATAIGRPVGSAVWVREVMMAIDGVPAVVARSVTPLDASHGAWQGMRRLRNRPLADMLYHDAGVSRSPFTLCALNRSVPLYRTVSRAIVQLKASNTATPWADTAAPWLARRSVFWRLNRPLMVAECFLPPFWK